MLDSNDTKWWELLDANDQMTAFKLCRVLKGKDGKPLEVDLVLKVQPHDRMDGPQQVS